MNKYMKFAERAQHGSATEDMVLLLDCSGSMESTDYPPSRLKAAIEAACALVDVKAHHYPHDRIAVVSFSSKGQITHQLAEAGRSAHAIKRALRNLTSGTSTNITSGLQCAVAAFTSGPVGSDSPSILGHLKRFFYEPDTSVMRKPNEPHARRVLLLSDGEHTQGARSQLFEAAKRMKNDGMVIAGIGIGGSPSEVNEDDLQQIVSCDAHSGQPLYCFIGDGDTESLIREFKRQAHHIQRVTED